MTTSTSAAAVIGATSARSGGFAGRRRFESVHARARRQPRRRGAPAGEAHVVEHAALEIQVRAGVEAAAVARRAHRVVERHLAVGAAVEMGAAVEDAPETG